MRVKSQGMTRVVTWLRADVWRSGLLLLCVCLVSVLAVAVLRPGPAPGSSPHSSPSPATSDLRLLRKNPVALRLKSGQPGFSIKSQYSFSGFEVDLARFLGKEIGFNADPQNVPSKDREEKLESGAADLVIGTYSYTRPRDKRIDFTAPYMKTPQGILVRRENNEIKSLKDLKDKKLCTAQGSVNEPPRDPDAKRQDAIITDLGVKANIVGEIDFKECVKQLKAGNYHAIWSDKILLQGFAAYDDDLKVVKNIKTGPDQYYAVGIRQGYKKDCEEINRALRRFLDGQWREAFRSHFPKVADSTPDFEQKYKPSDTEFDAYKKISCGAADKH